MNKNLKDILIKAMKKRVNLSKKLLKNKTDCWRIFNGEADERPGLTIDRYGKLILIQNFYDPSDQEETEIIKEVISREYREEFFFQLKIRDNNQAEIIDINPEQELPRNIICQESGLKYQISTKHKGLDTHLFLDIRVAREYIGEKAGNCSLLNLFAYTCSMGIKASACGAKEVWNIDFSQSALNIGMKNRDLNGLQQKKMEFFKEDIIAATRQFSGLGIKGKARRNPFLHFKPRKFDLVFLDPPTLARGKFGTVDIINDYQSIFKPALLSLEDGGTIVATNHHHSVELDQWVELLKKAGLKAGKKIKQVEILKPDDDFPSIDGKYPLKIVALTI